MDRKKKTIIVWVSVDRIRLVQGRDQWRALLNTERKFLVS
jgi:hypothetical protein